MNTLTHSNRDNHVAGFFVTSPSLVISYDKMLKCERFYELAFPSCPQLCWLYQFWIEACISLCHLMNKRAGRDISTHTAMTNRNKNCWRQSQEWTKRIKRKDLFVFIHSLINVIDSCKANWWTANWRISCTYTHI